MMVIAIRRKGGSWLLWSYSDGNTPSMLMKEKEIMTHDGKYMVLQEGAVHFP